MKRFFLLPICLFLSILCYSQEINIRSLKEIDGIQYTHTGEKYTGKILSYDDNGKVFQEIDCKNGKLDGLYKLYFINSGILFREGKYKNNELDGVYKEYYESGKLKSIENYKNGILQGVTKEYYENGILRSETKYKDGSAFSLKTFYEDGRLRYEGHYNHSIILYEKSY